MWFEKLTIGQLADQADARWPNREALSFEGRRWSYAQFRDEVDKAAKALIAAGLENGEHVCLWLVNRPEYLFLLYAIAKIGAVQVPINTRFRTQDTSYIVAQSDATTLISADRWGSSGYLDMIEEMVPNLRDQDPNRISAPALPSLRRVILLGDTPVPGTLNWDALLAAGKAVADGEVARRASNVDADATAMILYTSGTTGSPKGVMHGHNILRNLMDFCNRLGMSPNDDALNYLPLYHAFGLWVALAGILTGSRQVLMPVYEAGAALSLIEAEHITMIHGFDTHFKGLLEHPSRPRKDVSSLRVGILAAGMRSTEPIARPAQELVPTVTGYGMTEVGVGVTVSFLDSDAEVRTTMSGWPQFGYEIKICDPESGATLAADELGEICIRGYGVMQGYYRKPAETAAVYDAQGWFHSGDTGYLRSDGCLRFLGRYKDMLKVGGENVDPMEVEALLLEDARINNVAIVGLPDARLSEVPVAFVIPEPGVTLSEEQVLDICRGSIADFKSPRHVFFVDEFPMTGSGKVQKFLLRQEAQRLVAADAAVRV